MTAARALAAALALLAGATTVARAEAPIPPRHRALLALRVVVYDRNLDRRPGVDVVVAIAHRAGDARSEADRDALLEAFEALGREFVAAGNRVVARAIPFRGEADLAARLGQAGASAVWICDGLAESAAEIARATRRARVLSLGGARALVEAGLAVALVPGGKQARIVVNLTAARAEGSDLDAALLALAEVISEPAARR